MIKTIHTCWINKSNGAIPTHIQHNIELFKKYFPGFEVRVWAWGDVLKSFGSIQYIKDCYDAARYSSCVSALKCLVLDKFGGIWIDSTTELKESILYILPSTSFYLSDNYKFIYGAEAGSNMFSDIVKYITDIAKFIKEDFSISSESTKNMIDFKINHSNAVEISSKTILDKVKRHTYFSEGRGLDIFVPLGNSDCQETIENLKKSVEGELWTEVLLTTYNYAKLPKNLFDNCAVINKDFDTVGDALNYSIKRSTADMYLVSNPNLFLIDRVKSKVYNEFHFQNCDVLVLNSSENKEFTSIKDIIDYSGSFDNIVISNKVKSRLDYWFEPFYENIENIRFCLNAFNHGLKVKTSTLKVVKNPEKLLYTLDYYREKLNKIYFDSGENSNLTAVLAFINEGTEVERTIMSLRYNAKSIKVLLVDDCSTDGFDYESVAKLYNCKYIKTPKRGGSVAAKHLGGMSVDTPYFCFFDAHMRVYKEDWDVYAEELIKDKPKTIISSRTLNMSRKDDMIFNECQKRDDKNGISACCRMIMSKGFAFDPKWCDTFIDTVDSHELSPVACVLGATYLMHKSWWEYIQGFKGLHIYGLEESYMSLKTWLLGGECYVTKHWAVSHMYRDTNPAPVKGNVIDTNRYFLSKLFLNGEEQEKRIKELFDRIGEYEKNEVLKQFSEHEREFKEMKEFLEKNQTRTLDWYFKEINAKVTPENASDEPD